MHPAVRMAERFLEREGIGEDDGPAVDDIEAPTPSLM
jgi:hypothetical protein